MHSARYGCIFIFESARPTSGFAFINIKRYELPAFCVFTFYVRLNLKIRVTFKSSSIARIDFAKDALWTRYFYWEKNRKEVQNVWIVWRFTCSIIIQISAAQ